MPICRKFGNLLFEKTRMALIFFALFTNQMKPPKPHISPTYEPFLLLRIEKKVLPEIIKRSNVDKWISYLLASWRPTFVSFFVFNRRSTSYWESKAMGIKKSEKKKRKKDKSQSPNISAALSSFVPVPTQATAIPLVSRISNHQVIRNWINSMWKKRSDKRKIKIKQ